MKRETKTFSAQIKAPTADLKAGEFVAVVSVFNSLDMGGDRVMKGAFANAIASMKANGDVLPIVWSHEWDNPMAHIGYADPADMIETDEGLQLKGVLDTDRPFAEQVSHLMKTRRVKEFSFGYFVNDYREVEDPELGTIRELLDIDIFEAGPTLKGMHPDTRLLQAASALKREEEEAKDATAVLEAPAESIEIIDEVTDQIDQETPVADVAGDTTSTIDTERLVSLLVKPRN